MRSGQAGFVAFQKARGRCRQASSVWNIQLKVLQSSGFNPSAIQLTGQLFPLFCAFY